MDLGRLPSGGDMRAPAEGSGPSFVTMGSRCPLRRGLKLTLFKRTYRLQTVIFLTRHLLFRD